MNDNKDKPARLFYLDNIRWMMIILVVAIHASVTYSGIGSWLYTENKNVDDLSTVFFLIFQVSTQAYFMGLLFFIAGLFVPDSLSKKGSAHFIKDRLYRLGLPTLLYIIIIGPISWLIIKPDLLTLNALPDFLRQYYLTIDILGRTGPLWFALALIIFSVFYSLFRQKINLNFLIDQTFPSKNSVFKLVALLSIITFIVRIFQPIGVDFFNLQFCFFTQYIFLFGLGIMTAKNSFLEKLTYKESLFWLKISVISFAVALPILLLLGGALEGDFSNYVGGFHSQSLGLVVLEQFFGVTFSLGLLGFVRERFNFQNNFAKLLTNNAFSVYVWHAPILISVTLAMNALMWHPIVKFLIATVLAVLITLFFSKYIVRKIPLLKNIMR